MRGRNEAFANGVANPVIANLDVLRALIDRVVEVDQGDCALVVDAEVDGVIADDSEFEEESAKPNDGFRSVNSGYVFRFGSRERN